MNLRLAHRLIADAEHQPAGFLKVRGREAAREVHLMAEAGLVKATESGEPEPTEAVIVRITHGFGGKGIRTPDFQLAKLALYQLSYAPGRRKLIVDPPSLSATA